MALSIVADPIPTMQASAVSVSEQAPLTLFWWFPSSVSEQPGIAPWVVQGTSRPDTLKAARRIFNPRLDSRQGTRLYPDVIFGLGSGCTQLHRHSLPLWTGPSPGAVFLATRGQRHHHDKGYRLGVLRALGAFAPKRAQSKSPFGTTNTAVG